jgi:hypothetical protein
MAFGAALAGFAQGFLGGMKAGQDFQEGRERIQSRRELNRKAKNENDAADELAAVAKAQRQRGASTAATGGVTSQAIAAPTQALTPASAAQTPESTVAAAIPEAMYDDSEQSAYAEGGRVTRRTDAAHNTELSAQEQKAYDEWLRKQGRRADLEEQDYDMRGAYASGAAGDGRGHFPTPTRSRTTRRSRRNRSTTVKTATRAGYGRKGRTASTSSPLVRPIENTTPSKSWKPIGVEPSRTGLPAWLAMPRVALYARKTSPRLPSP